MQRLTFLSMVREVVDFVMGKSVNFDVMLHPGRYSIVLPLYKIIADGKVSKEGVETYKAMILNNEDTGPITLLKHPTKDIYVVLVDGHHRYYAYLELGKKELDCAVAGSYSSILFYLATQGRFQPSLKINVLRHPNYCTL